ncbi:MAG TPA: hypothetical protein VFM65_10055 [Flavobacteriaceae bacterium]|nr:hypothetical protein [Flavobacteriaceae bacterium]
MKSLFFRSITYSFCHFVNFKTVKLIIFSNKIGVIAKKLGLQSKFQIFSPGSKDKLVLPQIVWVGRRGTEDRGCRLQGSFEFMGKTTENVAINSTIKAKSLFLASVFRLPAFKTKMLYELRFYIISTRFVVEPINSNPQVEVGKIQDQ